MKKSNCITVIPIGQVPDVACKAIMSHIRSLLHMDVQLKSPLPEAHYALDPVRNQYNAALILHRLESSFSPPPSKILGVINRDLFIPVFTHVFGEAREGGQCALVSLFRLRERTGGIAPSQELILQRTVKVALHELSHLFNVPHCNSNQCVMHFSMNIQHLDATPMSFCTYCDAYLREAIQRSLPDCS